jgi:hypothetical protein
MKTTTATASAALPAVVTDYLKAANRFDATAAALCFATDASVRDEDKEYSGRDAIHSWVAETGRKYRPAFTVMRVSTRGDDVSLSVAVAGQFPGSPVTLEYHVRLRNGLISALTIE